MKKIIIFIACSFLFAPRVEAVDPLTGALALFGGAAVVKKIANKVTVKKVGSAILFAKFIRTPIGRDVAQSMMKSFQKSLQEYRLKKMNNVKELLLAARVKAQFSLPVSLRSKELGDATNNPYVADRCKGKQKESGASFWSGVKDNSESQHVMSQSMDDFRKVFNDFEQDNQSNTFKNFAEHKNKLLLGAGALAGLYAYKKKNEDNVYITLT